VQGVVPWRPIPAARELLVTIWKANWWRDSGSVSALLRVMTTTMKCHCEAGGRRVSLLLRSLLGEPVRSSPDPMTDRNPSIAKPTAPPERLSALGRMVALAGPSDPQTPLSTAMLYNPATCKIQNKSRSAAVSALASAMKRAPQGHWSPNTRYVWFVRARVICH